MTARREWLPLLALVLILVVSAAWWALALWPLPADTPDWLQRTRAVCFGATHDSLPSAAGWSLLIGEPLAMLGALVVIWGVPLRESLGRLWRTLPGRIAEIGMAAAVLLGLALAAGRVSAAVAGERFDPSDPLSFAERLARPAPALSLVDQRGDTVTLAALRGRPFVVGFAYAHCQTVCPVVVHELRAARAQLGAAAPRLVLITLDPWRDVPARLPAIASGWELGGDDLLLTGRPDDVMRVVQAWGVAAVRDSASGEITHSAPVFIVDEEGIVRWQAAASAETLVRLLR